jgi:tetratricopeptide (TPR) repeat protein
VVLFERLEPIEAERDLDDFDEQIEVAQYYFRFGETLRALGRNDEAVSRYEHTLELNDTHLPSLEALGPLYMDASDWKRCELVYRKLLQLTGGRGEPTFLAGIYTQLGHIQRHLGVLDKAKKRFNKALELKQNDVRALLGLAAVQYDRGEWNNLLNVFNNVIFHARERSEVISAYLAKGYVLDRKLGLPDKAADHYRKSLNFDPDEPRALLLLGELSLRKQEWDEAGRLFGQALGAEQIDVLTRANLLLALAATKIGSGAAPEAADLIDEALGVDVTLGDALAPIDPTNPSDLIGLLADRVTAPGI